MPFDDKINFGEHDPQVRNEIVEITLRALGDALKTLTPPGFGFILIMAALGDASGCFYASSVQREDAIKLLTEMLEKLK